MIGARSLLDPSVDLQADGRRVEPALVKVTVLARTKVQLGGQGTIVPLVAQQPLPFFG